MYLKSNLECYIQKKKYPSENEGKLNMIKESTKIP